MEVEDVLRLKKIMTTISDDSTCVLDPPIGPPTLECPNHKLPADLEHFYSLCGGAKLFLGQTFEFKIVSPYEFRRASCQIVPEDYEARKSVYDADISADWYLAIVSHGGMENIVIDLNPSRLGWCYDGYINTFASSDCCIVADSFTSALEGIVAGKGTGTSLFWQGNLENRVYIYEKLSVDPPNA